MRWYLDTEFHEDGKTIDLISIALVSEAGDEYYAISNEFDEPRCGEWLRTNVLSKLPPRSDARWKSREVIANEIRSMLIADSRPEIWAYFADYDWVAFCQLFGTMLDLPSGLQKYCRDVKQEMDRLGIEKSHPIVPKLDESEAHDALADARWTRRLHSELLAYDLLMPPRPYGSA